MKYFLSSAKFITICLLVMLAMRNSSAQVIVFSDDFSANTSTTWTTSGAIGASAWTVSRSGDDWGARRNTSPLQMECTNDVGATANVDGYVLASTPTTSFTSPYNATLNAGGFVTWTFNMRQIRLDPAGFSAANSYGVAFILAGTSNTTRLAGSGYAIILGQSGTTDPVRLVSYATGLGSAVNIITSNTTGLTDFGAEYLSIRITYNPCNSDQWEFFLRNDGASGFADPLTGTLTSQGTANNSTLVGTSLPLLGAFWQGSTLASQTSFFDNVTVSVIPKPSISLGSNPTVCQGTTSATLAYSVTGGPDQYSIDYNAAANSAGFVDVVNTALPVSPIPIVVPSMASIADYSAVLTVRNSVTGCVSINHNIIVHVINCTAPYLTWIPLPEGENHGSCTSATECAPGMGNEICYGLQYTPNHSGVLTSYTTAFTIDCSTNGNPILTHSSCVMTTHDTVANGCASFNLMLLGESGNSGNLSVTQNVPVIVHQVCLAIPTSQSLNIAKYTPLDFTTSINLTGGGFVTEFPVYTPYSASWDQECVTLPLRWLGFTAVRFDELMSQLDWTTSDEINNSFFEVQRSNDFGRHFLTIGMVMATSRNEAVNEYQFIDRKALTGKNFYRIKQVDIDGRYDYSPVKTVTFTSGAFIVKAWPNPTTTELTISIDHADATGNFILVDLTGKQVLRRDFDRGSSEHTLTLNDLQPGMYTLIVTSGENRHAEKIVIIK